MFFNNWLSCKALQAGAFSTNPVSLDIISIRFSALPNRMNTVVARNHRVTPNFESPHRGTQSLRNEPSLFQFTCELSMPPCLSAANAILPIRSINSPKLIVAVVLLCVNSQHSDRYSMVLESGFK